MTFLCRMMFVETKFCDLTKCIDKSPKIVSDSNVQGRHYLVYQSDAQMANLLTL